MFYGSLELVSTPRTVSSNNYWYNLSTVNNINAIQANPMFVDNDYYGAGRNFADFEFTITNPAIPQGVGSSITKVRDLIGKDP